MPSNKQIYDITIVGGGPTGLFAAFYGGLRQMKVKIIESLPQLGGQLSILYPDKYIYDVAGFPKVKGQELIDDLIEQALQFDPTIVLDQSVEHVEKLDDGTFKLTSNNQKEHFTKTVVITAGVGAFKPRLLDHPDSAAYEQQNLHYYVDNLDDFKGKRVMVCGGGDSAVDWALMLEPIASKVILVHRRDKFRAFEHSVNELMNSSVLIRTPFEVKDLIGSGNKLQEVVLQEVRGEQEETYEIDDLLVNYGFISSLGPIKTWGLEIARNSIVVNSKMETNIKGIYAAGDVTIYDGKVKLLATGFGEAPTAVNNAKAYIDPSARTQPVHSTHVMGEK